MAAPIHKGDTATLAPTLAEAEKNPFAFGFAPTPEETGNRLIKSGLRHRADRPRSRCAEGTAPDDAPLTISANDHRTQRPENAASPPMSPRAHSNSFSHPIANLLAHPRISDLQTESGANDFVNRLLSA